jgi:hypothetical protein
LTVFTYPIFAPFGQVAGAPAFGGAAEYRRTVAIDRGHEAENARELERLRALVARLSDADLARPMPADWTVAAVLAHIAFWDARAIYWLDRWADGLEPTPPEYEKREDVEWINNSNKPHCLALPPRAAAELALRVAGETERKVASISDQLLAKVHKVGPPFALSRAEHQGEHLDDIDRAHGLAS